MFAGAVKHVAATDQEQLTVEAISSEALTTSEIEEEVLDRASVQSRIRRQLGLATDNRKVAPAFISLCGGSGGMVVDDSGDGGIGSYLQCGVGCGFVNCGIGWEGTGDRCARGFGDGWARGGHWWSCGSVCSFGEPRTNEPGWHGALGGGFRGYPASSR